MIRDLTRHIVLPYNFDYTVSSSKISSLLVELPSFSVLPSKSYTFRNFRIEVGNVFTTASTSPLSFTPPTALLKGIINEEGISEYLNSFSGLSAYTYKGILSNTDLSATSLEVSLFPQTNNLQLTGNISGLNPGLSQANVPNFIEAKQTLFNGFTGASSPSVFNYFRYADEFYFLNTNFKQLYFCFTLPSLPVDSSKTFPSTFNFAINGFFAFDLDQYSN